MKWIHRQSFAKKLAYHAMLTTFIALFLASAGFMIYDMISVRRTILNHTIHDADNIGLSSMAAIQFKDRKTVKEILDLLSNYPRVIASSVYLKNGELFSTYTRMGESIDFPALPDNLTHKFSKGDLELFKPIILLNQRIGVVYIKRDLEDMYERFWNYALIVVLVLCISSIVAMLSSVKIQSILSQPIDELVQSAKAITKKRDYSIRAKKISHDELGILTDVFNDMLQQIQVREESLHQYDHIVSSSTDMMAIIDKSFIYLAVNSAYEEAFNKTQDDFIGNTLAKVFGEEFFNSVIKPNAERCLAGEKINYQDWFNFPTSGEMYMDINYYPYINDDNKVVGFVVNGRDITERKEAEQKIKQQKNRLEQMVNIATHDLKSSIISASGFTKMSLELTEKMSGKKEKDLPQELKEYVESINQHINKALDIVTEFLEGRKTTRVIGPLDQPVKFEKQPVENFPDIKKEYRKKQIFLIDDDKAVGFLSKKTIERDIDAEVTSMTNPIEAEKYLEKKDYKPDLILIDINMPEKNGFEVLDNLKALKRLQGTCFSIYSTSALEININTAKEKNVGYLIKDYDTLSSNIDKILHGKIIYPKIK